MEPPWRKPQYTPPTTSAGESISLPMLSTLRSLNVNSSARDGTVSSIETLSHHLLNPHHDHDHHHHILSVLSDLALRYPDLSHSIIGPIHSLCSHHLVIVDSSPRLAVEALSVLLSLADSTPSLRSAVDSLDDGLILSLCFRRCLSARLWLLTNATRLPIRPHLLVMVLLGCTKDPFPYARRAALVGLADACKSGIVVEDFGVMECCYYRGIELLTDMDDCVRVAAVRVVSQWGQMLVESKSGTNKTDWSDALFLQLCSVVRDMSKDVRVEAFSALERVKLVSEDMLLQSLSKKVLGSIKGKKPLALCNAKHYEIHASCAAGVFVHGLEDEFSEVRQASCGALHAHILLSVQFASEAVNLLMDVLNDDSLVVRFHALETINHAVTREFVKMQQSQMHMLLSTLADNSSQIRVEAMSILGSIKLLDMEMLKSSIGSLLSNLDIYPQDEAEVLHALFKVVQNHGSYAVNIYEYAYNEIKHSCGGTLDLDRPQVLGLVVLAMSAYLLQESCFQHVLHIIFSYALIFFGRISSALHDVMDQDTFFAFLSRYGGFTFPLATEGENQFLGISEGGGLCKDTIQQTACIRASLPEPRDWVSEIRPQCISRQTEQEFLEVLKAAKHSFASTRNLWQLIKSGRANDALEVLRSCKIQLEIAKVRVDSRESASILALAFQYVRVLKLFTKLWKCYLPIKGQFHVTGLLEPSLEELNKGLLELRHKFMGLSKEEELHILELVLLSCVLRLYICSTCPVTLKKLSTTILHVERLSEADSFVPSEFVSQLAKVLQEHATSSNVVFCSPLQFKQLLDLFSFKDFALNTRIKHRKAELHIPGFDSEHPLRFISGLPVGIPLEITLFNLTSENRLWIVMSTEELNEFVFLELDECGDCSEFRRIVFNAPFYRIPTGANAFTLKLSIGMECSSEDFHMVNVHGGPKHPLIGLCQEKQVNFVFTMR